jgi:hypothetical protein
MFAELTKQSDPRMIGKGHVFDAYEGEARATKYHLLVKIAKEGTYEWKEGGRKKKTKQADVKKE